MIPAALVGVGSTPTSQWANRARESLASSELQAPATAWQQRRRPEVVAEVSERALTGRRVVGGPGFEPQGHMVPNRLGGTSLSVLPAPLGAACTQMAGPSCPSVTSRNRPFPGMRDPAVIRLAVRSDEQSVMAAAQVNDAISLGAGTAAAIRITQDAGQTCMGSILARASMPPPARGARGADPAQGTVRIGRRRR